jgi:hypothetical protein
MTSAQYKKYQRVVFQHLPELRYLDNYQRDGMKPMSKAAAKISGLS